MRNPKGCNHGRLDTNCHHCRMLQKKWYRKLKNRDFVDIEYGLENPEFLVHTPDPTASGSSEAAHFYERVWEIFHVWVAEGRSTRDCRVAELLAMQQGKTGTVRGISRTLRDEKLSPWCSWNVQITITEIRTAITNGVMRVEPTKSTDPPAYLLCRYACA